jgi:hypothetical protein
MSDPRHPKPGIRPTGSPAAKPAAPGPAVRPDAPTARPSRADTAGRVVHDDRGHAVWQWVKEASRIAIDSTSRLLRKLEAPGLKMEDTKDEELRIKADPSAGGGYDPYNQPIKPPKSKPK